MEHKRRRAKAPLSLPTPPGLPLDHKAVIDACAEHQVVIEVNANPWRLDLDWRWVEYALSRNVLLSINPDAHSMRGYEDMRYGVLVGRKGGLTPEMTFNAKGREQAEVYFAERKKARVGEVNPGRFLRIECIPNS